MGWRGFFPDEKWGKGLVLVFFNVVLLLDETRFINLLCTSSRSSIFAYIYCFAYRCTAKTEISCCNAMFMSASACYLHISEYHGSFYTLILMFGSDYLFLVIILLIIHDIPLCLCHPYFVKT
jgi:hypothetical protein